MLFADRDLARDTGNTIDTTLGAELAHLPMDRFLDKVFGAGKWVHDPIEECWIAADPKNAHCFAVATPDRIIHVRRMLWKEVN